MELLRSARGVVQAQGGMEVVHLPLTADLQVAHGRLCLWPHLLTAAPASALISPLFCKATASPMSVQ